MRGSGWDRYDQMSVLRVMQNEDDNNMLVYVTEHMSEIH
jgi:hypothetical protein